MLSTVPPADYQPENTKTAEPAGSTVSGVLTDLMAVEVGFEPTEVLPPHTLSRRARSATTRLHRDGAYRAGRVRLRALGRPAAGPLLGKEFRK
jgi:hypothetical protein